MSAPLIVPVATPTSQLHFASIPETGTVEDVIYDVLKVEGLKEDILGDLSDTGWAIQVVQQEDSGKTWADGELAALGDGI
jgi:hypothetical protein